MAAMNPYISQSGFADVLLLRDPQRIPLRDSEKNLINALYEYRTGFLSCDKHYSVLRVTKRCI